MAKKKHQILVLGAGQKGEHISKGLLSYLSERENTDFIVTIVDSKYHEVDGKRQYLSKELVNDLEYYAQDFKGKITVEYKTGHMKSLENIINLVHRFRIDELTVFNTIESKLTRTRVYTSLFLIYELMYLPINLITMSEVDEVFSIRLHKDKNMDIEGFYDLLLEKNKKGQINMVLFEQFKTDVTRYCETLPEFAYVYHELQEDLIKLGEDIVEKKIETYIDGYYKKDKLSENARTIFNKVVASKALKQFVNLYHYREGEYTKLESMGDNPYNIQPTKNFKTDEHFGTNEILVYYLTDGTVFKNILENEKLTRPFYPKKVYDEDYDIVYQYEMARKDNVQVSYLAVERQQEKYLKELEVEEERRRKLEEYVPFKFMEFQFKMMEIQAAEKNKPNYRTFESLKRRRYLKDKYNIGNYSYSAPAEWDEDEEEEIRYFTVEEIRSKLDFVERVEAYVIRKEKIRAKYGDEAADNMYSLC